MAPSTWATWRPCGTWAHVREPQLPMNLIAFTLQPTRVLFCSQMLQRSLTLGTRQKLCPAVAHGRGSPADGLRAQAASGRHFVQGRCHFVRGGCRFVQGGCHFVRGRCHFVQGGCHFVWGRCVGGALPPLCGSGGQVAAITHGTYCPWAPWREQ